MCRYRKKPVVIEAIRYAGIVMDGETTFSVRFDDGGKEIPWLEAAIAGPVGQPGSIWSLNSTLQIGTLEGTHTAQPGDFIICGVKGEIYPCKPDIFAATYEAVE
jgi:hypothetical protein